MLNKIKYFVREAFVDIFRSQIQWNSPFFLLKTKKNNEIRALTMAAVTSIVGILISSARISNERKNNKEIKALIEDYSIISIVIIKNSYTNLIDETNNS